MFKTLILYGPQFLGNCGPAKSRSFCSHSLPLMLCAAWLPLTPVVPLFTDGTLMGSTRVSADLMVWTYAVGFSAYCPLVCVDGYAGATANVTCSLCQAGTYLTGSGTRTPGYAGA